jgi:hypothetical protein
LADAGGLTDIEYLAGMRPISMCFRHFRIRKAMFGRSASE